MASTTDHGGLYYAELIKSNLQFINGPEASIHVLTQLMEDNKTWQVCFMKVRNGQKTVPLSGEGDNLVNVLQELHRKSAGMLGVYFTGLAYGNMHLNGCMKADCEAETEAATAFSSAKASNVPKTEEEAFLTIQEDDMTVIKAPMTVDFFQESSVPGSVPSLTNGFFDPESTFEAAEWSSVDTPTRIVAEPYRTRSPLTDFVVARTAGGRRSIICPNYGPVHSSPRVLATDDNTGDVASIRERKSTKKQVKDKSGPSKAQQPEKRAPTSVPEGKPQEEKTAQEKLVALSPALRLQIRRQAKALERKEESQNSARIMMNIQWDGFGNTVVADNCRLSARVLLNRVREMLRDRGASLFGNAKGRVIPPSMFAPEELHKFTINIKRMQFDCSTVMVGPDFGDDLSAVVGDQKPIGFVKLDIDLQWQGE